MVRILKFESTKNVYVLNYNLFYIDFFFWDPHRGAQQGFWVEGPQIVSLGPFKRFGPRQGLGRRRQKGSSLGPFQNKKKSSFKYSLVFLKI